MGKNDDNQRNIGNNMLKVLIEIFLGDLNTHSGLLSEQELSFCYIWAITCLCLFVNSSFT